ncbi:hypothetical protein B0O80DRAFT_267814 [Mortierella sp. GBAus27b]|nr:hypothetical protein B0O80DRAFT_267814 [Mortierella sp. GBAus27b]
MCQQGFRTQACSSLWTLGSILSGNSIDQDLSYLVPWCGELTDLEVVDVTIWTLPLLVLNSATLRSLTFKRGRDIVGKDFSTPMSSQALSLSSTSGVLEFLKAMNDCQFLERLRLDDFEIEKHNQGLNRGGSQIRRIRSATEIAEAIATAAAAAAAAATAAPSASASRSPSAAQKASKAEQEAKALAKIKEETTASIDLFYRMAQKLTRLELIGRVILTPPPDRTLVFYRLRRLSLNGCSMSYRDQLQFICQCQYLTHLKLLVIETRNIWTLKTWPPWS